MKRISIILIVLSLAAFLNCGLLGDFTLTINLERDGVEDGTMVYAKLVDEGSTAEAVAAYEGSSSFNDGSATVTIENIEEGSYTAIVFIDENGNAVSPLLLPDCDEYVAGTEKVEIDDDASISITDNDWVLFSYIDAENEWGICD